MLLGYYFFADLPKISWHFKNFVNTGPYGAGNFKTLLLQLSSDVNQDIGDHGGIQAIAFLANATFMTFFKYDILKFF